MKPRIIIPLAHSPFPKETPTYKAHVAYINAVERAGGIALCVSMSSLDDITDILSIADGILFMGGVDVHPNVYGEDVTPQCGEIDMPRDKFELALIYEARKLALPMLGVCRGIQVLNIAYGGTLYQDIPTQTDSKINHSSDHVTERKKIMHDVEILPHTRLAKLIEDRTIGVNSLHHQGIKKLGEGLVANAKSPDGLVEGLEESNISHYVLAVHWHPEELCETMHARRIFESLISAGVKYRESRIQNSVLSIRENILS